jgi:hypothetical protein
LPKLIRRRSIAVDLGRGTHLLVEDDLSRPSLTKPDPFATRVASDSD